MTAVFIIFLAFLWTDVEGARALRLCCMVSEASATAVAAGHKSPTATGANGGEAHATGATAGNGVAATAAAAGPTTSRVPIMRGPSLKEGLAERGLVESASFRRGSLKNYVAFLEDDDINA